MRIGGGEKIGISQNAPIAEANGISQARLLEVGD
jgi:hypothetical protein